MSTGAALGADADDPVTGVANSDSVTETDESAASWSELVAAIATVGCATASFGGVGANALPGSPTGTGDEFVHLAELQSAAAAALC